jgi:asparagine synthase (glutamine-hydrolysing)
VSQVELDGGKLTLGAWGTHAGALLERGAERRGRTVHRVGELTMLHPPDFVGERWCCWLFGEPEDRGVLAERFGLEAHTALPVTFGRALNELGESACELLRGRFVIVALDRRRGRCLVTRDQLGAQPLSYTQAADGVLFAEHDGELLELLPRTPGPDRLALLQWVENGSTPREHSLYEGVSHVPVGHRLSLADGVARVERWWALRYKGVEDASPAALAERVREAAFAAVSRAAAGSRRPAVKLSGGLDSACVAAGLAANGLADGRALAIGGTFSDHPETDESDLIEATARYTHLPLERLAFEPDRSLLAPAIAHIARWRLPPATPNLFVWQPVMARARELGVDLMLDGEGGDERFGLAPYLIADRLRAGHASTAWRLAGRIPGMGPDPDMRIRFRVLRRYGLKPLAPRALRRFWETRNRMSPGAIIPLADARALAEISTPSADECRDGPLWWRYLADSLIDEPDLLGVGAHFRREAADERIGRRHPFLYDLELTEAVLALPPSAQFDPFRDRPLLRDGLIGLIPETVRTRHAKSHFTSVVLAGLRADEAELIDPLRRDDAPIRAYVAPGALERKIAIPAAERSILAAGPLWQVAIANRWLAYQAGEAS